MRNEKLYNGIDPHDLNPLKLKVYWALAKLETKKQDRFSVKEIVDYLIDGIGIKTSSQAVAYALGTERGATHKKKGKYKLMQKGKDQLISKENNIFFVEPEKPFAGKKYALENIFSKLKGNISICDPYCGLGLLDFVFKSFEKNTPVRILTRTIIDKPKGMFSRALYDLRKEGYEIEIKIYKNSILHDRYIIDDNNIWLSGNSFEHLGQKESFIVLLGKDIRQSILSTFNNRWRTTKNAIT